LVTVSSNSPFAVRHGRREGVVEHSASFVRLLVDELAAHPMPGREVADRLRSRQRLNGQVLTVTPEQTRRCANTSIHLAPHLKTSGCHHPTRQRQLGSSCNPYLNHALNADEGAGLGHTRHAACHRNERQETQGTPMAFHPPTPDEIRDLVGFTSTELTALKSLLATGAAPPPAAATAFTTALSASSGTVGNAVTLTVTPTGAAWPSSVVLTPAVAGLSGTFAPTTRAPSGTAATTFAFTSSAAGSGTIGVAASPSMTGPAGLAYQATAVAPTPTPAPAPTFDGTLANLPSTIAAGQPLSAVTYAAGQATPTYFVPFNVTTGAEEGLRWQNSVMGTSLKLLIPQAAATYTLRGYAAASGGSPTYESAQVAVSAAPGALPATPAQAADTDRTSSGVTMNWSATAASYHVLARNGVGVAYGSLADATVTTNSDTFTGLAASSSPRAVVIPQNANGYGMPSGQFLSSTTA
jgi:hypothetical protein